ncbi:MAG TPA: formylglycine-generating enzyme family protein [Rhodocyclaceae bacterium]|nr:formylglycine-generating enzyme family protein [Rhodocyclaceae bacterium]
MTMILACSANAATSPRYAAISGGNFRTALPTDGDTTAVAPFLLRTQPVSNREFAAFVTKHPAWRRGTVPALFADFRYLSAWNSPTDFSPLNADAPVIDVSWYAAQAYCASEHARLPTWYEWEFVAAADATRRDARSDPVWRENILGWYEQPANMSLPAMPQDTSDIYGVYNMHRLIWEWVEDYNGLFVTADSRNQGEQKSLETCGAAALSLNDRENYAVVMRIALLSSLDGKDNIESLGFRCARDK